LADLYDAIKTAFDADATLVTAVFDELHSGEVGDPTSVPVPYCTMVTPSESTEEQMFHRYAMVVETFTFQIVDATRELVRDHAELVNAAFEAFSLSLTVAGIADLRLTKMEQGEEQADEDRWVCSIGYQAVYTRRRPA